MASPFSTAAASIKQIFDTEFSAQGYVMTFDKLHEALGRDRVEVGIAPLRDVVNDRNALVQETFMEVRFYDLWRQEIDPTTQVDPTQITEYAERLRNALRNARATVIGTDQVWYFTVLSTEYPDDPTGNKTRFHMTVRAYGNNADLVETTA
jgi:hypothetical protein